MAIIFGGSTYQRTWPDAVVQIASLAPLVAALWQIAPIWSNPRIRAALLLCAAVVAFPLLQLVPMPPVLWTTLPGRGPIEAAFREANIELPWFPISLSPAETWRSALALLPPVAIFLSVLTLDRRSRRALTLLLICVGFFSVLVGLAQVSGGADGPFRFYGPATTAVGFFINRNHYAALLYTIIPFTAAWIVGLAADRRPQMLVGIGLCLLVFASLMLGLGMAQSRAGLTLAILAALASFALARARPGKPNETWARKLIFAGGFIGLLLVVQFAAIGVLQRLEADPLDDERWTYTVVTMRAARDFFPFGSGLGTFDSVYKAYEEDEMLSDSYLNNAHNDFAELFLEGGVLSAVLLAVFSGLFLTTAARNWRKSVDPRSRVLDVALLRAGSIAIVLLLLHSAVDYPLRSAALSTIFAFSCALMLPQHRAEADHRRGRVSRPHHANRNGLKSPSRGVSSAVPVAKEAWLRFALWMCGRR